MHFIFWLAVGGLIGWAAAKLIGSPGGMLTNVVIGIVGVATGGWVLAPMVGAGTVDPASFSAAGGAVSLLFAVLLLAVVNLSQRGRWR
jgi:uncharacterized membrane protein YeaQ/YmgE (transglycosylase-associated protein family)